MLKKYLLLSLILLGITSAAFGHQLPRPLSTDNRIKIVNYKPNTIFPVRGTHLIATGIQLGMDETITSAKIGDSIAWLLDTQQNMIYVKPVLPQSNTNLLVTTTKRLYQFQLITNQTTKNPTYLLRFDYPDEQKANAWMQNTNKAEPWNYQYSFVGASHIAPIAAKDNGLFTVFTFSKHINFPAIFAVDNHQNERLINFHVQGDEILIQGVHHQYTLRRGEDVTTVYNDKEK